MLVEDHIFTVKTKDPANVADVARGGSGIVITGLNVLREQIEIGDFVFVVFGGDKPKGWTPGLVALAHVSRKPYAGVGDEGRNFRIDIDVDLYFQPSIKRSDLVSYPDTFDTIGIGPITKWEPNQALTSVKRKNAIGLLQALYDLLPVHSAAIGELLGADLPLIKTPVRRFVEATSELGSPHQYKALNLGRDLQEEYEAWLTDGRTSAKTAYENATSYIPSIGDAYAEPTKQIWHGLREALYGAPAKVPIFRVRSYPELMFEYGGLDLIFDKLPNDGNFDQQRYDRCLAWSSDPINHGSIRAAWRWYKKFLQWKDAQRQEDEDKLSHDYLTIALRAYAQQRGTVATDGWDSYDAWLKGEMEEFSKVDESLLDDATFDYAAYMRKYAISWQVANTKFSTHGPAEQKAVLKFLKEERKNPHVASWYIDETNRLVVNGERVKGLGPMALLYFMSELRPDEYAAYSRVSYESLQFLGLHEGQAPVAMTLANYEDCKAKQTLVLSRMREMGIKLTSDDDADPNYRTVNHFLWFVNKNRDLIKEEVMKTEFKRAKRSRIVSQKKLSTAMKDDPLLLRLAAALRTKPFAILAGHSGTGKSQMVRRLAYMTCFDEGLMAEAEKRNAPGNYCMIQVRPNWHDSTDLLGYYSEIGGKFRTTEFVRFVMKAYAYPEVPFFVCLDEMNLAPVEQYFAEYLSAIESASRKEDGAFLTDPLLPKGYDVDDVADNESCRFLESKAWYEEYGLTIPKNLFVVGTVNMDDTTCQFSRKVLDRAMTIMMDQVKFEDMMDNCKSAGPSKDDLVSGDDIYAFLEGKVRADPLTTHQVNLLNGIEGVLGKTPFAVAYRFANEYALYEASLVALTGKTDDESLAKEAMDHCVLMKVLPRIHGTDKEVERLFRGKDDGSEKGLEAILDKESTLSGKKMEEILARKTGYLSFWP